VSDLSRAMMRDLTYFTGHKKKDISLEDALQKLKPAEKDLELLRGAMDVVADYWIGVDTELQDIETRFKVLRDGHMLQMKIKGLQRNWKEVEKDHKSYINAVRAFVYEQVRYLLFSAQHTPGQQSTIQGICSFKARDNSAFFLRTRDGDK
jgi:hypothetical protein